MTHGRGERRSRVSTVSQERTQFTRYETPVPIQAPRYRQVERHFAR